MAEDNKKAVPQLSAKPVAKQPLTKEDVAKIAASTAKKAAPTVKKAAKTIKKRNDGSVYDSKRGQSVREGWASIIPDV